MWNLLARVPSELFICPQFQIKGGYCPDFVALNLRAKEVWIVEVSGKATLSKRLREKTTDAEKYVAAVKAQLAELAPVWLADWKYSLKVFVRKDAKPAIPSARFLEVRFLEDLKFPWHDWDRKFDES